MDSLHDPKLIRLGLSTNGHIKHEGMHRIWVLVWTSLESKTEPCIIQCIYHYHTLLFYLHIYFEHNSQFKLFLISRQVSMTFQCGIIISQQCLSLMHTCSELKSLSKNEATLEKNKI